MARYDATRAEEVFCTEAGALAELPAAITRFGLDRSLLAAAASRKVAEVLCAVRGDTLPDHGVQSILLCQSLIESLSSFQFKPRGALFPRLDPARLSFV